MHIIEWTKQHPYETAGIVFGAGAIIIIGAKMVGSGGSGSGSTTSANNTAQALQFQAQQDQLAAQQSRQSQQLAAQLQTTQIQAQAQEEQIAAALAATENTNSSNVTINAANNATSQANTASNNAAAVQVSGITVGGQVMTAQAADAANVAIAQTNAQTQQQIANYETQAVIAESNNASSSSMFGSALGFLGGLF